MAILNLIDDGVNDFAIYQGRDYQLSLFQVGNITGDFVGIIRDNYLENAGNLLGEFTFDISFDIDENKTSIIGRIPNSVTALLPFTKFQGVGIPSLKNSLVYDIDYHENGFIIPRFQGFVQVKPDV